MQLERSQDDSLQGPPGPVDPDPNLRVCAVWVGSRWRGTMEVGGAAASHKGRGEACIRHAAFAVPLSWKWRWLKTITLMRPQLRANVSAGERILHVPSSHGMG